MAYKYTWDEWCSKAKAYAKTHDGVIAGMKQSYVNEQGDKIGAWVMTQKNAYKYRFIPKEKRLKRCALLTDEQIQKLEDIGIIWTISGNRVKIINLCKLYNIDIVINKKIIKTMPFTLFQAKINYCIDNDMPLTINDELNEIFVMSNANMYNKYGITVEDLFSALRVKMKKG